MGRAAFQPTDDQRRQAETLAGLGLPQDHIALVIGVDDNTLRKHLGHELKLGKAKATAKVAQTLFQKAVAGDTASLIFWMKAQAGWRETTKHELTGADGRPIETEAAVQFFLPANGRDGKGT